MELGISTKVLRDFSLADAFSVAEEYGYNAIEIWIDDLISSGLSCDEVIKITDDKNLKRSVHLRTDDLNIASFNDGIREESLRQAKEGIILASKIGAREATLHPGRKTSKTNSLDEAWEVQLNSIRELLRVAKEWGVTLCVEGMEKIKGEFILTPDDLRRVVNECQNGALGVTIDVSHLQTIGDAVELLNDAKKLPVCNIHISQASANAYHLPLFDTRGEIDYREILGILKTFYEGSVIIEGYQKNMSKEILEQSMAWYKNILKESV